MRTITIDNISDLEKVTGQTLEELHLPITSSEIYEFVIAHYGRVLFNKFYVECKQSFNADIAQFELREFSKQADMYRGLYCNTLADICNNDKFLNMDFWGIYEREMSIYAFEELTNPPLTKEDLLTEFGFVQPGLCETFEKEMDHFNLILEWNVNKNGFDVSIEKVYQDLAHDLIYLGLNYTKKNELKKLLEIFNQK